MKLLKIFCLIGIIFTTNATAATLNYDGTLTANGFTPNGGTSPAPFDPVLANYSITYDDSDLNSLVINSFSMSLGAYNFTAANVSGYLQNINFSGGLSLMARIYGGSVNGFDLPTDFVMGIFLTPGLSGGYGLGGGWISYGTGQVAISDSTTSWSAASYYTYSNPQTTVSTSGTPLPSAVPLPAGGLLLFSSLAFLSFRRRSRSPFLGENA